MTAIASNVDNQQYLFQTAEPEPRPVSRKSIPSLSRDSLEAPTWLTSLRF
jgi:hypothetical protein